MSQFECRSSASLKISTPATSLYPQAAPSHDLQRGFELVQRIGQVGLWEYEPQSGLVEWSSGTYRVFGVAPISFTPSRDGFLSLVHRSDRERVRQLIFDSPKPGATIDVECRALWPNGQERVIHLRGEPVVSPNGMLDTVIGTAHDVTDRKRLEGRLWQSQKMEAVGRLAAGLAHDFNNILTVIRGYSDLMLTVPEAPETITNLIRKVATAAERASNLTRQLITFSRRQVFQPKPLDLNVVIGQTTQMLQRLISEEVSLVVRLCPELPPVWADVGMLEQVLAGLAVNGRDAMPRGGTLVIETGLEVVGDAEMRIHPESQLGDYVWFSVSDTGSTIEPDAAAHIFEPFYSSKELGRGSGLGLAIVYGIVKQHHGWVDLIRGEAIGNTFRVYLPALTVEQTRGAEAPPSIPESKTGETVLVVEDEPALRALATAILVRFGYRVMEAASGPEALKIWEKSGSEIDLVFTDMVMPGGMTGRELATELQRQKSDVRILYTTGYSVELVQANVPPRPGIGFIPKPYDANSLAQAVDRCLHNGVQAVESAASK